MRFENSEITIRNIPILQLTDDFLSGFERFQETKTVWVNDPSNLYTKESFFIDDWNEEKKILVVNDLRTCLYYGGFLIAAYQSLHLVGFGCIDGNLVGNHKEYLELVYLHVTRPLRGFGIGKKLFIECCNHAREVNAKKLYIASHPSVETQAFYFNLGCIHATETIPEILAKEPLDIQLEFSLRN